MLIFNQPCRVVALLTPLVVLILGAVSGMQEALQAQQEPLLSRVDSSYPAAEEVRPEEKVVEIRIVGNDTIATERIASHLNTRVGRQFDRTVVAQDVLKLDSLGWFVDVKPLYEVTPEGRIVFFQVVERPTIRYVTYLGNKKYSAKKLDKQTNIKQGGSIDPYAVEEGRRKIREYYQSSGYNNVQVTILEGTKATDQGVIYLIHEGQSQKIWKVNFVGNSFVPARRLKSLIQSKPPILKLFKGYVNREQIDADVDQLKSYYRTFGFFAAEVGRKLEYNDQGNWVELTFVIDEGPRYQVRDVRFLGNTKFEPEALSSTAKLLAGQDFEQAKMQQDTVWLQELYGSHGYVFADIKPEIIYLEKPGEVDLVYHIEEGSQWRVGRILVQIGGENPHTRIQTALNRLSIHSGEIMDIRKLKASERRLMHSGIFLSDAASGVRPKITYKIPEDTQVGLASSPKRSIRGQSPENPTSPTVSMGPPVKLPPVKSENNYPPSPPIQTRQDTSNRRMDVVVEFSDQQQFDQWRQDLPSPRVPQESNTEASPQELTPNKKGQPSHSSQPTGQPPELVIRGQSPTTTGQPQNWWAQPQGPTGTTGLPQNTTGQNPPPNQNSAYAQVPSPGNPSPYGGQMVGATDPSGVPPAGYNAGYNQGGAQPTYGQPQQPAFGVPTTPNATNSYPTQGSPVPGTPAPTSSGAVSPAAGYQLFPDGSFGAPGQPYPGQAVDVFVNLQEAQTGRLMIGAGVNSNAGIVGNIVLDERNFDWRRFPRSFEEIRNGTAWRGDSQRFRIDASPGSVVNRYVVSFQQPYLFDSPISLGLSGSLFDRRYTDYDEQRLGGRVSLGYQMVEHDLAVTMAYRGENVKISDISDPTVEELSDAYGSNTLHGFRLAVNNDTRDSAFLPTQGHYAEVGVEQVIGTYEYTRGTFDFRQYFLMRERPDHSGRHVLSLSTRLGFTGSDTPIYDNFFAGGYSTLRGFDFRGASPVDPVNQRVVVGGEFQWINSVEYLFPITADEMLHGVVFSDFGTVERVTTIKDFRVAIGAGLRITVPAMGPAPIALDFAWTANKADFDETQVFSFSLGYTK